MIPKPLEPVLAYISQVNSLGTSYWYEVVYHDGNKWCCFAGSDTFQNGESVLKWKYVGDCFV